MVNLIFCDLCGKLIDDEISHDTRTYSIKHAKIGEMCNMCYKEIVRFIESLK